MRVRVLYGILCTFCAVLLGVLTYMSLERGTVLFYVVEALALCVAVLLWVLYRRTIRPLRAIANGMELLREQDFGSRLRPVGMLEADRAVEVFNRMMKQLRNEHLRVREQNRLLDLMIEASPMGVVVMGGNGEIVSTNPAARSIIGADRPEELAGKTWQELHTALADELDRLPANSVRTIRLNTPDVYRCSHLTFYDSGYRHSFFLIESLTGEVTKAEKAAYEKVIRMIAHEVNNATAGVTSLLDTASQSMAELPQAEDIREVMQVCIERCLRMSRFITRFADVVKIPEPQLAPADIGELLASCARFMEPYCRERRIRIHCPSGSQPVVQRIDLSLFEQALANILKNAAESIGERGDIYLSATPGTIVVADTGKGIAEEVRGKLFDPFFSTKPNGQGIGLLFVREVLSKHGCAFSLQTDADGLTRFTIRFHASAPTA